MFNQPPKHKNTGQTRATKTHKKLFLGFIYPSAVSAHFASCLASSLMTITGVWQYRSTHQPPCTSNDSIRDLCGIRGRADKKAARLEARRRLPFAHLQVRNGGKQPGGECKKKKKDRWMLFSYVNICWNVQPSVEGELSQVLWNCYWMIIHRAACG